MLKPQFPLVSMGNSFSRFKNGRYMNIGNMKIFLGLLESTSNILSVMKQFKALLHIDNPYRHPLFTLAFPSLFSPCASQLFFIFIFPLFVPFVRQAGKIPLYRSCMRISLFNMNLDAKLPYIFFMRALP